ncbi:hypothetical protein SPRG_03516 [Saprolegnia parasitica CBS 223.65]|uniref:Uncharacterized protein n=1 Tax=Saprolegnia parasitica (strain CBS 223.65) TaxID=695850 RepID=A0A067CXR3_SAPPC|nr:hypothetical protein SPRG_03516 [Saprolegnia parasitica CBS 223.65]KDO31587.1 hypothetical protein SPRG_03516 [Saprolegnia parasitica CBS 223.65]|eukprot:XP_012197489.1 hypothetical protein SPRG_03516 [Saprolegnia parasitica CBS 223.65]
MGLARATTTNDKKANNKKKAAPAPIDYAAIEHPYVVLLNKKLRSLKKKQEKIKSLEESMVGSNKTLNEQQLEVLANKTLVEKMYAELEALRVLFVETTILPEASAKVETPADAEPVVEDVVAVVEDVAEVKEETVPAPTAPAVETHDLEEEKMEYVGEILKLLHAVSLHQALGHDVPIALDYFVKVLMGGTRPPAEVAFKENLAESMVEAKRYLTQSEKVLVCDMSYHDLREAVDRLVNPVRVAEPVVEAPQINFFAEPDVVIDVPVADATPVVADDVTTPQDGQVSVPEESTAPVKSFAAAACGKRPSSGNRRKNSPRNNAPATAPSVDASAAEKPKQPRRQYKPKATTEAAQAAGEAPKPRPQRSANKPSSSSPSPTGESAKGGATKSSAPRRPRQPRGPKKESETP